MATDVAGWCHLVLAFQVRLVCRKSVQKALGPTSFVQTFGVVEESNFHSGVILLHVCASNMVDPPEVLIEAINSLEELLVALAGCMGAPPTLLPRPIHRRRHIDRFRARVSSNGIGRGHVCRTVLILELVCPPQVRLGHGPAINIGGKIQALDVVQALVRFLVLDVVHHRGYIRAPDLVPTIVSLVSAVVGVGGRVLAPAVVGVNNHIVTAAYSA